ncbi:hypothetical protein [Algibacter sp. 2305UL17-15]|uniref:hypothetical protein n=1 Tax=Algibacter sp. 2305UL17-15 TaxID=3231268 RepID=UPI003457DF10
MKTNIFTALIAFFIVSSVFAQTNLNNYKYVIVPKKFDFLKSENEHRLNELAQFLFNKYGFTALMEGGDYPEDLQVNRCLALRSDVFKESGMFKTKLNVQLKDCNDRIVYTSQVGESREKDYKTAYNIALRQAFESFETLNYKYEPSEIMVITTQKVGEAKNETSQEIEKLKEEIQSLKKQKEVAQVKEPVVVKDVKSVPVRKVKTAVAEVAIVSSGVLYAQAIENGFQLVDSAPKVVFRIKNTGLKDVFLVEDKSALIYKNGDIWFLEYYDNNTKKLEELNIKF